MVFNSSINRSGAQSLIPEQVSKEVIQGAIAESAVLRLARRLPDMSTSQTRMPVLAALPSAYFVTGGDTGLKQTTEMSWGDKYLDVAELAVIVPIPENVLADVQYDIWGQVQPRIREAIGAAIDLAILFGTNAPAIWPDDILTGATAAGHTVAVGSVGLDIADDIFGIGGVYAKVEADGFPITGQIADMSMMALLRSLRTTDGQFLFMNNMQQANSYLLGGRPIDFSMNGGFDASQALMFAGDWRQLVFAVRQDITYKILDQAVLQDGAGNIIYNLPQQDMVALRAVMRLAWQLPNPISKLNPNASTRYPFAALTP